VTARERMTPAVSAAVVWHLVGGLLLAAAVLGVLPRTLRAGGGGERISASLAGGAALTGLALVGVAAAGASVGRAPGLLALHVLCGLGAVLAPAALLARRAGLGTAAPALLLLAPSAGLGTLAYQPASYYQTLTATTPAQASNPLFPAGTRIQPSPDWKAAPRPADCARGGCHPAAHQEWLGSAHARTEENPVYGAARARAEKELGRTGVRWCAGCHSPLGGAGGIPASRGIDCLACHAMARVPDTTGNGRAAYAAPAVYPFVHGQDTTRKWLHGFLLRVRPAPHRATLRGPGTDRLCAPCHRLSVGIAQNHYRHVRYDDTWTDWQQGPHSGETVHATGRAPAARGCADCHMPAKRGGRRSHALRRGAPDAPSPPVTVEVFALRRPALPGTPQERMDAPLAARTALLRPGETAFVDVVVTNQGIGHGFPAGVPDLRSAWLEFTATDFAGRVLLRSGGARQPEDGHRWGLTAIDREGRRIESGQFHRMIGRAVDRAIQPGESDVVRYRLAVPAVPGGALVLTARLRSRRLPVDLERLAPGRAGVRVVAEHSAVLPVAGSARGGLPGSQPAVRDDPSSQPRFLAYGIALFGQRDLYRARRAFLHARNLTPTDPEPLILLGRTHLEEGVLLSARSRLLEALRLRPDSARARAWLGRVHRRMGQYDEALRLLAPLARSHPLDKAVWFDIGRSHFQSGRYEEAGEAFRRMLAVDPDDPSGHFGLMQCYLSLRRVSAARTEEMIYRALRDQSPPARLLDRYLAEHPDDAREARPIHEHPLRRQESRGPGTLLPPAGPSRKSLRSAGP